MENNFKPYNGHIAVTIVSEIKKMKSGLEIPDQEKRKMVTEKGVIVSLSSEAEERGLKVGDTIHFMDGRSFPILLNGEMIRMVRLDHVVMAE